MKQLGAASGAAVLGTAAYNSAVTQQYDVSDVAAVRVGHLAPDAGEVDVYLNKPMSANPTLDDVQFADFKPDPNDAYLAVPDGEYDVSVSAADSLGSTMAEMEGVQLDQGARYTLLAVPQSESDTAGPGGDDGVGDGIGGNETDGENETDDGLGGNDTEGENETDDGLGGNETEGENETDGENDTSASQQGQDDGQGQQGDLQLITLTDSESGEDFAPPENQVEVRFVHASPGADTVTVSVEGTNVSGDDGGSLSEIAQGDEDQNGTEIGSISFGEATDYQTLDAGEVTINVGPEGQQGGTDGGVGGNETDDGLGDNETDDGLGDNETDDGLGGNETEGENETDGENDTSASQQGQDDGQGQQDGQMMSVTAELYEGTRLTAYVTGAGDAGMGGDTGGDTGLGDDTEGENETDDEDDTSASQQGQDEGQGQDSMGEGPMVVFSLDATSPHPDDVITR